MPTVTQSRRLRLRAPARVNELAVSEPKRLHCTPQIVIFGYGNFAGVILTCVLRILLYIFDF